MRRRGKPHLVALGPRLSLEPGAGGGLLAVGEGVQHFHVRYAIASAVHHHLIQVGLRMDTSIIAETAQAWSTHHMNCLVGYGAHAVHPYLLWRAVRHHYELNNPNPNPNPNP